MIPAWRDSAKLSPAAPNGWPFFPRLGRLQNTLLAVDAAPLEAEKAEGDRTGRNDGPLCRIHGIEVANQVAPGIEKPSREREIGYELEEHGELGWEEGVLESMSPDRPVGSVL